MTGEALKVGAELTGLTFGPLAIVDTVRWAGVQENDERIHFDRDFARQNSGLKSFIISGGHRQALLARTLTDLVGVDGRLLRLRARHTAPTFEGDTIRFSVRPKHVEPRPGGTEITCDVEGNNQEDTQVMVGSCVLFLRGTGTAG